MPHPMTADAPLIALEGVSVIREGNTILSDVHWVVGPGSGWILFRANGSGKTTLPRFDKALMLAGERLVAHGHVESALTEDHLWGAFDLPHRLTRKDGKWRAWSAPHGEAEAHG